VLTFLKIRKKEIPIIGIIDSTSNASFQLIEISNILAPTITNTDETIDATA
jgi:hypothetical protein